MTANTSVTTRWFEIKDFYVKSDGRKSYSRRLCRHVGKEDEFESNANGAKNYGRYGMWRIVTGAMGWWVNFKLTQGPV